MFHKLHWVWTMTWVWWSWHESWSWVWTMTDSGLKTLNFVYQQTPYTILIVFPGFSLIWFISLLFIYLLKVLIYTFHNNASVGLNKKLFSLELINNFYLPVKLTFTAQKLKKTLFTKNPVNNKKIKLLTLKITYVMIPNFVILYRMCQEETNKKHMLLITTASFITRN